MIVTCTMNPAIDLFVRTKSYQPKVVNRTLANDIQPNGKGVNVSFILKMLGIDNLAIGFLGGFTGAFIREALNEKGIDTNFVEIAETTRINVFTKVDDQQTEYKLVNQGPVIEEEALKELFSIIQKLAAEDILCVSGSNPQGVTDDDIMGIAKIAHANRVKFVLDTSSRVLLDVLPYRPYCIKPNDEELAALFEKAELSQAEIIHYGKQLVKMGAQHVLVSLGEAGAYYFSEKACLKGNAPKGILVNSACAGDTMLATFVGLLESGQAVETCLKTSIAAASSTAFTEGLTDFKNVPQLMAEIVITTVN
ncbi:1-phosphofructokinase [Vagococcus sp. BWB3-3]|uniref:Tagatose-6-phosphate kinase n=1 Tax=Vagococcus allomyrinae TaxID=2794353 RepID=A0A940PG25_9ENTE|nr:1-phosphofructokinase [Vagococcus allomyrinae]MBP1042218.1 1-phosphofructokinase [Vagococcus allomyrinae]